MTSIERWHTSWRWAVAVGWLVCSVTNVSAQDRRWERLTAMGVQAVAQGDYAEAARQFQAALPLADAGSLVPSLMHLAAVYEAQGQYTEAAPLYQLSEVQAGAGLLLPGTSDPSRGISRKWSLWPAAWWTICYEAPWRCP